MQIFSLMGNIILNDGGVNAQLAKVDESAATTAASLGTIGTSGQLAGAKAAEGMGVAGGAAKEAGASAKVAGEGFATSAGGILKTLGPLALMFGAFAGGQAIIKSGVEETNAMNQSNANLVQTLKSTGDASGMTAKQVQKLSENLGKNSLFSKSMVQDGENMLLTFTNIGKNVFPQASQALVDLSQKMGKDPKEAAIQLGKALNDPVNGVTALKRVGVQFSDSQKSVIDSLVKTGDIAGAQKVIIAELNKEFGGQASAATTTYQGKVAMLKKGFDELAGGIVNGVEKALTSLGMTFMNVTSFFEKHHLIFAIVAGALAGIGIAIFVSMLPAIGAAIIGLGGMAIAAIAATLPFLPLILICAALAAAAYLIVTNWSSISAFFVGVWNGITGVFWGVGKWFGDIFTGAWNGIKTAFSAVSGFFEGIWDGIKSGFSTAVNFMISGLNGLIKGILLPFNVIIKGLDLIPGVHIPQLSLAIPNIPRFDVGTRYLPSDTLIQAHKGEMIVPKSENPYANSGGKTMPQGSGDIVIPIYIDNKLKETRIITSQEQAYAQRHRTKFKAVTV